ncbi:MAG: hypothetical protein BWK78_01325 [Thiotrichaceae bacterium IS1]|nr:MAG: hypothetical protein BWK78_01325 [Thiotrichaceae bacterium IS1]
MRLKIVFFLLFLLLHNWVYAIPEAGSCADEAFKFQGDPKNEKATISTTIPVRVLKEDAPLYENATDAKQVGSLKFDAQFKPIGKQEGRIHIADQHTEESKGWVDKHDLLCNFTPLSEKGLPRKAFVKIPTSASPDYFIPSYPSSEEPIFGDESKIQRRITRFQNFFIFSEDKMHERALLSPTYNLPQSSAKLIGWVDMKYVIQWKTNLGIRPKETTGAVSGYISLKDKSKSKDEREKGVELTGGNIWYTFPLHIPLLDIEEKHYKVAAPGIGMTGFRSSESGLLKFNHVDLFFLLDGTASMEPYIRASQLAIKNIIEKFEEKFKEANLQCGFLIYRDDYADKIRNLKCRNGLCEFQPIPAENCNIADITSCNDVVNALSKVKATKDDNDDYEESLFDGLAKTVSLITPCPKRTKFLIVIGDHGDREDKLPQPIIEELAQFNTFPFFIQTSNNQFNINSQEDYRVAYSKFQDQMNDILERLKAPKDFFIYPLDAEKTPNQITETLIGENVNPGIVNELEMALATGESINRTIEKYRSLPKEGEIQGDMSVFFWEKIEEEACNNMPEQCNKAVHHRVNEFFIPVNEKLFEKELLLLERHIKTWRDLLNPLVNLNLQWDAERIRKELSTLATQGFTRILGDPPIEPTETKTLEELVTDLKIALPVRPESPLFQYSPYDFNEGNENKIKDCEVNKIREWIQGIDSILARIVSYPEQKVLVEFAEYDEKDCPLSDKGKRIKKIRFKDERERLGPDDSYRYGHAVFDVTLYWVPLEFLP